MLAQFDIHSPANTVLEALNFSAELRLEGVDARQRKAFVDEVRWHVPLAEGVLKTSCELRVLT